MIANKFKQMLQDEGAVSPVIGVILMVAVTVVLGAVIGAFVFGIGDKLGEPAPNAQINFDYNSDNEELSIVHDGGDSITEDNTGKLTVTSSDTALFDPSAGNGAWGSTFTVVTDDAGNPVPAEALPSGSTTSGDTIYTSGNTGGSGGVSSGAVVGLQWQSAGGSQSTTLGTFEAP